MSEDKKSDALEPVKKMAQDIDQIRGYVRFMALIVLFQLCLIVIIGLWIGMQLAGTI